AFNLPELRVGEVVSRSIVADDVRHHAVAPLALQQCAYFGFGARTVVVRQANGNKSGIPVPLVRVLAGTGLDEETGVIVAQDGLGFGQKRGMVHMTTRSADGKVRAGSRGR